MIIELREIVQEDIKTIKPWLTDKENAKWLDSFFQNEILVLEKRFEPTLTNVFPLLPGTI